MRLYLVSIGSGMILAIALFVLARWQHRVMVEEGRSLSGDLKQMALLACVVALLVFHYGFSADFFGLGEQQARMNFLLISDAVFLPCWIIWLFKYTIPGLKSMKRRGGTSSRVR